MRQMTIDAIAKFQWVLHNFGYNKREIISWALRLQ